MRILLIEDDENLQFQIRNHLTEAKYSVDVASDGESGLFQGQECPYDAAIVDLGLPKIDGVSIIKTLRQQGFDFPILILTARGSWQDKVSGLDVHLFFLSLFFLSFHHRENLILELLLPHRHLHHHPLQLSHFMYC